MDQPGPSRPLDQKLGTARASGDEDHRSEAAPLARRRVAITSRRWGPYLALGLVVAGAFLATFGPGGLWGRWLHEQLRLHTAMEAVGGLAAIIAAILLLDRQAQDAMRAVPAAVGLLAMGVLDGLHAISPPGQTFVLLRSSAALIGALSFATVWLPWHRVRAQRFWTRLFPAAVVALLAGLGAACLTESSVLPHLVAGGLFSAAAKSINLVSGVLFGMAALRYIINFHRSGSIEEFLFACLCLMFGVAGVMFGRSTLWDDVWWSWHIVRLAAYALVLWLIHLEHGDLVAKLQASIVEQLRADQKLRDANAQLEQRVQERTAELRCIQSVTETALRSLTLNDLLGDVLAQIRATFAADSVGVCLLTSDGSELELRAAFGMEPLEQPLRFPSHLGVGGHTLASGRPVFVEDVSRIELASQVFVEKGIRSMLAIPLRVENRVIGVLHVGFSEARKPAGEETTLLQLIGDRVAVAIDRSRLYEAEREAHRKAEVAMRAREQLLAVVSHDLRSPLSTIILGSTFLRGLVRNEPPEERQALSAVESISRSAAQMGRLIDDLLDAAKIEAGAFLVERQRSLLQPIIDEAVEAVRPLASEKAVRIEPQIADPLPDVLCDRGRILQVLLNLLTNGIKFTPAGGVLTVKLVVQAGQVRITVSDTGPGIADEDLPHLFDRYWQAKRAVRAGAGLGLYIAKGIVEAHGGQLSAASKVGVGSEFFFTIPTAHGARERPSGELSTDSRL